MKNSASHSERSAMATLPADTLLAERGIDFGTIESVLRIPLATQPLLSLQRLAFQQIPVIIVCDDFRSAQRYFCEAVRNDAVGEMQPFILHEMMPAHHQDYVFDNITASRGYVLPCNVALFTTRGYFDEIARRLDWLVQLTEIISAPLSAEPGLPRRTMPADEAMVSCICLRAGATGRWLLMDHDEAAVVYADQVPAPDLIQRLLRHTVNISGDRLAPYLAMMFDVPQQWKVHPELATRSLLVFTAEACSLGCYQPGIPQRIIWSDLLGLLYEG